MNDNSKYIISYKKKLYDALVQIDSMSKNSARTLFVVNQNEQIIGTLTDGDIRRSLIKGVNVESSVKDVIHTNFKYLDEQSIDVRLVRKIKNEGIFLIPVLSHDRKIVDIIDLQENTSYLPIDAVLMAGGKGERLRPLTEKKPKPLIKVGDKAIIDYNVDRLINYGVRHINVTVNYLADQLEKHFEVSRNGIKIKTIREPKFLGTIGSIKFIQHIQNDVVLVMNSDLFTNIDYEDFFLHFMEHNADMSVASVPYIVKIPYGVFNLDGRQIKGVEEKPAYSYYANAGIYLIKKELLNFIPSDTFYNATDFMSSLIQKGFNVIRFPISGYWIDIGQHDELERAREIAKHIRS